MLFSFYRTTSYIIELEFAANSERILLPMSRLDNFKPTLKPEFFAFNLFKVLFEILVVTKLR